MPASLVVLGAQWKWRRTGSLAARKRRWDRWAAQVTCGLCGCGRNMSCDVSHSSPSRDFAAFRGMFILGPRRPLCVFFVVVRYHDDFLLKLGTFFTLPKNWFIEENFPVQAVHVLPDKIKEKGGEHSNLKTNRKSGGETWTLPKPSLAALADQQIHRVITSAPPTSHVHSRLQVPPRLATQQTELNKKKKKLK